MLTLDRMAQNPNDPRDPRPSRRARYSDLLDRMRDGVFLLDIDEFAILEANEAASEILGFGAGELLGRPVLELAAVKEELHKSLRIARRRYASFRFETKLLKKDGTELEVEMMACGLALNDGNSVVQLIARDITLVNQYMRELSALNQRLEELSVKDEMTGLANFRFLMREVAKEHERIMRYGGAYAILFCDVDHFKHYNDRNGHPAGDRVLKSVADLLRANVRKTDLPARYGGEEFVVLCPGIDAEGARILAERIRATIETHPFEHASAQPLGKVSISVGVTGVTSPPDSEETAGSFKDVIQRADEALYRSKKEGRNRVTLGYPKTSR